MSGKTASLAQQLIEKIFVERYRPGMQEVSFTRDDLIAAARDIGANRPENIGDIVYSLRYRAPLPEMIQQEALSGQASPSSASTTTTLCLPKNSTPQNSPPTGPRQKALLPEGTRLSPSALLAGLCDV